MKQLIVFFLLVFLLSQVKAQSRNATWIWYPGDFEIWLSNQMQNRRTERGAFFPPFWRQDNHYVLIDFHKEFELDAPEDVELYAEGQYNAKLDGKLLEGRPSSVHVPAGKHKLSLKVYAHDKVPAIYVKGRTVVSDSTWLVTFEDKEWIDETGKASDQSGTAWQQAASWKFDSPKTPPSSFRLATVPHAARIMERLGNNHLLVDFGKETFGFVKLHGITGSGRVSLYYGESREEALATATCETLDRIDLQRMAAQDTVLPYSKAFRYVLVEQEGVQLDSVSMLYEYLPVQERGAFRCSDTLINRIWDIASYTMELTTREFFIDGIKRDRWIWSGDAYQSYLMNYYLNFDLPSVTRTILALRGKEPVSSHINTIMDYSFYWFISIFDYYQYTGDQRFVKMVYPKMQQLMEFCLGRRNADGFLEGLPGDWIFIDWAEGLSKQGAVSFEQLLLCRSLETMKLCAEIVGDRQGSERYEALAAEMKGKVFDTFWDAERTAFVHSAVNGKPVDHVTRYTNMFAIFFDYLSASEREGVKTSVLLNKHVPQITTPYMRFYELEALCTLGEHEYVLQEMRDYWGGMLALGATSFWEEYNPAKKGAAHYAMYGRPFGKSLCHSWGASPIYLLGKYYLGVKPIQPGYSEYRVEPNLGDLSWIEGTVPTPQGDINLYVDRKTVKIQAGGGTGRLIIRSRAEPTSNGLSVRALGGNAYELMIPAGRAHVINYKSL